MYSVACRVMVWVRCELNQAAKSPDVEKVLGKYQTTPRLPPGFRGVIHLCCQITACADSTHKLMPAAK